MKESIIGNKSFDFALHIIQLYKELIKQNEYILSKQLLRSGTSIGANVREASSAESKKDFIHKMGIASKEAKETEYWLLLLEKSNLVEINVESILQESQEIIKILVSIVKTSQENQF
jgi:four helix bundle protein